SPFLGSTRRSAVPAEYTLNRLLRRRQTASPLPERNRERSNRQRSSVSVRVRQLRTPPASGRKSKRTGLFSYNNILLTTASAADLNRGRRQMFRFCLNVSNLGGYEKRRDFNARNALFSSYGSI